MPDENLDQPTYYPPDQPYPVVVLPLEGWRQVRRRIRQLRAIHGQQEALLESLYQVLDAMPDEGGND